MIAMFTMFEIFGRSPQRFDTEKLKSIHRINGRIYFLLFLLLTYICIDFIIATKVELSSRATFHSVFSLAVLVLFLLKISFVKIYRQFYGHVQVLGILVVLFTFGIPLSRQSSHDPAGGRQWRSPTTMTTRQWGRRVHERTGEIVGLGDVCGPTRRPRGTLGC